MFRLPVCPHCGTVYRYKDTKNAVRKRENTCYHCHQPFKAKVFPYILIGALLPLAACIGINIFLMTRMDYLQLLPLFGVTLVFLLIIYLLVPFFTHFKITKDKIKEESNKRRNHLGE